MAFENIKDGRERRTAQAMLNGYNRQIKAWQRDADKIVNQQHVELQDYVGYTSFETEEFTSLEQFKRSLENRRRTISDVVEAQRSRMMWRERLNRWLTPSASRTHKRGRPKSNTLPYGAYVHFAVAYNHGYGAEFLGYGVGGADPSPTFAPTHISAWANNFEL